MHEYRVVWEIDIVADSPKEAAEKARKIQLDPESTATHFTATNREDYMDTHEIDLEED